MTRHVAMQNAAVVMGNYEETVQDSESESRDREEVSFAKIESAPFMGRIADAYQLNLEFRLFPF